MKPHPGTKLRERWSRGLLCSGVEFLIFTAVVPPSFLSYSELCLLGSSSEKAVFATASVWPQGQGEKGLEGCREGECRRAVDRFSPQTLSDLT